MILSIIILNWNTKELLRQCLKSLISNIKYQKLNMEIVVVDNGSRDGSQEYLKKLQNSKYPKLQNSKLQIPRLKVIFNRENLGFAKANNQGIKIAQGEYIMLLNSDTIVSQKEVFKILVEYLEKYPKVGAVSPQLLNPDGTPQNIYYLRFPSIAQAIFYYNIIFRHLVLRTPRLHHLVVSQVKHDTPTQVDQLPGAALVIRKKALERVGLLDEDYPFLFEDVDWCYRAKKQGFKLCVVPKAKIIHLGGASWKRVLSEKDYAAFHGRYFASLFLFLEKHYSFLKRSAIKTIIIFNLLTTAWLNLLASVVKREQRKNFIGKLKVAWQLITGGAHFKLWE